MDEGAAEGAAVEDTTAIAAAADTAATVAGAAAKRRKREGAGAVSAVAASLDGGAVGGGPLGAPTFAEGRNVRSRGFVLPADSTARVVLLARLPVSVAATELLLSLRKMANVAVVGREVWLCRGAFWRKASDDHFLTRPAPGHASDAAWLPFFKALVEMRVLQPAADDQDYYSAACSAGGAGLPAPQQGTEREHCLPALLSSLAPGLGALPRAPQPAGLALELYGYQQEGLAWMLSKEQPAEQKMALSPLWRAWAAGDGHTVYQNGTTGTLSLDKPLCCVQPLLRGGILADAMGLGKTAQLAALILAHPFDASVPDTSHNGHLMAEKGARAPVRIRATMVVVTAAIAAQWVAELKRWAPSLVVVRFPEDFASLDWHATVSVAGFADVIVATYEAMARMVRGQNNALIEGVSYWRVVLDEAQTCFDAGSSAARAVSWLWKSNVWCTTGTPLGNNLADLHGLTEILDHDPFGNKDVLVKHVVKPYHDRKPGAHARMRNLLASLMLRREANHPSVLADVRVPEPTWEQPPLRLSPHEMLRYQDAYQAVFRAADAELAVIHRNEIKAEERLRGWAAKEAAKRARAAAAGMRTAKASAVTVLASTLGEEAATRAVEHYLAIPAATRIYDSPDATHVRSSVDMPTPEIRHLLQAHPLLPADRDALDQAEVGVWNAEQDQETVRGRIAAAESATSMPMRWQLALREAEAWLLADEDAELPDNTRRRRNDTALLGGTADLHGTVKLQAAVTHLRRMLAHPSIKPPGQSGTGVPRSEGTRLAEMLSQAALDAGERTAEAATAAWAAQGGQPGNAAASAAAYAATRREGAAARLAFLQGQLEIVAEDKCPICLGPPGAGDAAKISLALPCLHRMCTACLNDWLGQPHSGGRCPCCRKPVEGNMLVADARKVRPAPLAEAMVDRHGSKLAWLLQDLRGRLNAQPGLRCLIFSQFDEVLHVIAAALESSGIGCSRGFGIAHDAAAAAVVAFKTAAERRDASAPVALLLPLRGAAKSAAAGVNLQEASLCYLFDPSTSNAIERQAVGRIARIGQTAHVTVVRLALQGTLEMDVLRLQQRLGTGRSGGAGEELVTGADLAILFGIGRADAGDGAGPSGH